MVILNMLCKKPPLRAVQTTRYSTKIIKLEKNHIIKTKTLMQHITLLAFQDITILRQYSPHHSRNMMTPSSPLS